MASSMKKFDPRSMPYMAAIVQTFQYALAGSILIGLPGWFFGGLLGLLVSFSMAYASSQISDIARKRTTAAWVAFIGLAIISPVYVGTATFYDLEIVTNPYWRGVVAAVWGLIPDGSIALAGFVAGKGMVKRDERPQSNRTATESAASTRSTSRTAEPKKVPCEWCGKKINDTQNARNAHSPHCKVLQAASK